MLSSEQEFFQTFLRHSVLFSQCCIDSLGIQLQGKRRFVKENKAEKRKNDVFKLQLGLDGQRGTFSSPCAAPAGSLPVIKQQLSPTPGCVPAVWFFGEVRVSYLHHVNKLGEFCINRKPTWKPFRGQKTKSIWGVLTTTHRCFSARVQPAWCNMFFEQKRAPRVQNETAPSMCERESERETKKERLKPSNKNNNCACWQSSYLQQYSFRVLCFWCFWSACKPGFGNWELLNLFSKQFHLDILC